MPTVLSYTNAYPSGPYVQHGSGQTTTVQTYIYPGAVQPKSTVPAVLSYTNAYPDAAYPQHGSGQSTTVQSYLFSGGVEPLPTITTTVDLAQLSWDWKVSAPATALWISPVPTAWGWTCRGSSFIATTTIYLAQAAWTWFMRAPSVIPTVPSATKILRAIEDEWVRYRDRVTAQKEKELVIARRRRLARQQALFRAMQKALMEEDDEEDIELLARLKQTAPKPPKRRRWSKRNWLKLFVQ